MDGPGWARRDDATWRGPHRVGGQRLRIRTQLGPVLGGWCAVPRISSSGIDRDPFGGAIERGEVAVMGHETHAQRLHGGGHLSRIQQPHSGACAYAGGAMRDFRAQVDDAPRRRRGEGVTILSPVIPHRGAMVRQPERKGNTAGHYSTPNSTPAASSATTCSPSGTRPRRFRLVTSSTCRHDLSLCGGTCLRIA